MGLPFFDPYGPKRKPPGSADAPFIDPGSPSSCHKLIAHAVDSNQIRRILRIGFDFFPEFSHRHVDRPQEVFVPAFAGPGTAG